MHSTTTLLGLFFLAAATSSSHVVRATYTYTYVNYTAKGYVTPVKDQGQCELSYAFAAVAQVESLYLMNGLGTKDFSEQQILDCTYGRYSGGFNMGCAGGNPYNVLQYFNETSVVQESAYPYRATLNSCGVASTAKPRNLNSAYVHVESEDHLAYMLNKNGPVAVMVNADGNFQSYSKGVYTDAASCSGSVNHVLLLVGLVNLNGQEQWILKNSWGTAWGERGFIRFPKGVNMCGMITAPATVASFGIPIVV